MAAVASTPVVAAPVVPTGTGAGAGAAPSATAGTRQQAATLYVGDLNPDVEESDLYTAFNAVVEVQHIRIARDAHTRKSRGYAFVNFKNAEDAQRALQSLNYTSIKGRACRIMWAQRDPTPRRDNVGNVFVKNLGPKITVKELNETFKIFGAILSCKVATGPEGESKGYGFVHFQEADAASEAIANVNGLKWEGQVVECKPYVPRENRSGPGWNNLFIKNVPKEWTEVVLRETFVPFGEITSCKLAVDEAGKSKGFGFVCFSAPSSAQSAEKELNGKEFDGTAASPSPFKKDKAATDGATTPTAAGAGASSTDAATATPTATAASTATPGKLRLYVGRHIKKAERERLQKEAVDKVKREKAQQRANRNLWVGNLDESVDDDMLRKEFSKHGLVESAVVARDPAHDHRSRLFGYVLLSTQEEASKALAAMNHKMVQGKPLYVRIWEPKETRAAFREQRQEASRNARGLGGARGGAAGGVSAAALSAAGAIPSVATANPAAVGAAVMSPAMMTYMARAWNNYATGTATQQDMLVLQQWFYMMYMAQLQMQQQQQRLPNAAAAAAAAAGMVPPTGGVPGGRGAIPTSAGGVPAPGGRPGSMPTMAMGGAMPTAGGMPFMMPGLAGVGNMMMPQAPGVPVVAGGVPSGPGAAVGPRGAGGVPRGGARAGPTRGATGTATGAPTSTGRPGASVTSPGSAAAAAAGRGPTAASVVRGGSATGGAPTGAAYRPGARNTDDSAAVPAPVAAAAPSAVAPSSLFASELVAAEPDKRKNMIGERLYSQIAQIDREKAGKITGMLLESIDESELLHLLEAAPELEARVREAQQVLHEAAKAAAGGAAPTTTTA